MPHADPDEYRRYHREWMRKKRGADRESDRAVARAYYARHKEVCRERKRVYRSENADKIRESHQKWKAKNPNYRSEWEQSPNGREITRKHAAARRAKLAEVVVEEVLHSVVFERDRYTCMLCGIKCDPEAGRWASNLPTLDHIIPLAHGGEHSYGNTQTLCRRCNCRKGDR
ncbi:MAG: HNH endonuclease [Mycobacterium sp.]